MGFLVFSDSPQNAPIIHLGGPRKIICPPSKSLLLGHETDLMLNIRTPGLGAGTTAAIGYADVIPKSCHPRVEITFPSAKAGEPPIKVSYELKERC